MSGVDTRHINRDALFLVADVRRDGDPAANRVKVRNLSAGGMMAEGDMSVVRGARVTVELKNLPPVDAHVAWVQDGRFGLAFAREIDPKAPRASATVSDFETPRFVRPASLLPAAAPVDTVRLRKI